MCPGFFTLKSRNYVVLLAHYRQGALFITTCMAIILDCLTPQILLVKERQLGMYNETRIGKKQRLY